MHELRPKGNIQKLLISSTSRFVGEYETEDLLITHAFPLHDPDAMMRTVTENPLSRNALIVVFKTDFFDGKGPWPDYTYTGEMFCIYLAILFGKRFDNHGLFESNGLFSLPSLQQYSTTCDYRLPQNNHQVRKGFDIENNLIELKKIERLWNDNTMNQKFLDILHVAGSYYLQALQTFEKQPESAYINLVTSGEVLSSYPSYDKNALLDDELRMCLERIETDLAEGEKISNIIRNRLYQIKKRFVRCLSDLVNESFFGHSECTQAYGRLSESNFETAIKSAYDLRSRYLHTGARFGNWISRGNPFLSEVQLGKPVLEDKGLAKIIFNSPTYFGLERLIRFCLLRFMQMNGLNI